MKKTLLIFSASWCQPCKMYKQNLDGKAINVDNYKVVDIDEYPDLTKQYQIRSVPTTILFIEGEETKRKSGAMTAEQLNQFID